MSPGLLLLLGPLDFVSAGFCERVCVHFTLVKVHKSDDVASDECRAAHGEVRQLPVVFVCQSDVRQVEIHVFVYLVKISLDFDSIF